MPKFQCQVCDIPFEVPQKALDKYSDWVPKYCRDHSPKKGTSQQKKRRFNFASREENLTRAEVLTKYLDGPDSGMFTDGSATPNPGPGGWGMVWVENNDIRMEKYGHESGNTTNNRMELTALLRAYESLPQDMEIPVFTDSRLCVDTITKWAPGWEKKGWKRAGAPLKNLDLVQPLLDLYRAHHKCPLQWIEAHSAYRWNEYADCLATAWLRSEV